METAPAKSPLHNFPLPYLKWGSKNPVTIHQRRRPLEPPPPPFSTDKGDQYDNRHGRSPSSVGDHEGGSKKEEVESENLKLLTVGSLTARNRDSFVGMTQRHQQLPMDKDRERVKESCYEVDDECRAKVAAAERDSNAAEVETAEANPETDGPAQKPWNLRPRRSTIKPPVEIGGGPSKNGEFHEQMEKFPKSMRLRGFGESSGNEKREKRRFLMSLSREEIEEDIYSLTGSKPARRPRKRAKNVQKELDKVFPGLWLVGLSPDAYRGLDAPLKVDMTIELLISGQRFSESGRACPGIKGGGLI
ncbi:hypothetical protein Nepgr_028496 [Nepenthes gracilis]|uniref:Uncharacterized protein n=1 Tax=Nepenthes gracilis TaxID=150966 RepID=A0AAD3Y2G9_NEPGR|nr:hypothetical protein Nepgr_028496 [Nepenthes gracilis]